VLENIHSTSTYHLLKLQVDGVEEFNYVPGQYIVLKIDDRNVRDYSLASLSYENIFELIIDLKPGNEGSYYIYNLREGDKIQFLGPMGNFQLHPKDGSQELLFLGTGSGIAPLKAMIEQLLFRDKETRSVRLYFGLRHCSDIFMHDYFGELDRKYPNFIFIPCLSQPDDNWRGDCGHITDLVKRDYREGSHLSAYLCGNGAMIEEAKRVIASIGTPEARIYHEKFY
jgi:NAD(P)H-flavin reductase